MAPNMGFLSHPQSQQQSCPPQLQTLFLQNIHSISADDGGPASSHFGVYQQTTVGSSDDSIWTLVQVAISAAP